MGAVDLLLYVLVVFFGFVLVGGGGLVVRIPFKGCIELQRHRVKNKIK